MAKKKAAKKTSKKSTAKKSSKKSTAKKSTAKKTAKKSAKKASKKSSGKKSSKKKPGLYANIHKAQQRAKHGGRKTRKKGEAGAPTEADFKKSEKTAKK